MTGSSPTNDEIEFTAVIRRGDIYDARIIGFDPPAKVLLALHSNSIMADGFGGQVNQTPTFLC
jgi:hypothetical protein